ncbi:MAG TPA: hypothetical protein PK767_06035 [Clostridiales bacterium]|nr:hypothetical protein [Clostridiales bacterium]HOL92543.1 hypothetical protein [Clostridiales bacterium]HPP35788.1 hypothetical protein [Clostridiales bacterium]
MKNLKSISPAGLAIVSALAGIVLVLILDEDSLDAVGNVFVGIGGILLIAAAQNDYLDELEKAKLQNEIIEKQLEYFSRKRNSHKLSVKYVD